MCSSPGRAVRSGRRLIPQLIHAGHEVTGSHRRTHPARSCSGPWGRRRSSSTCSTRVRWAAPCSRTSPRRWFTRRLRWGTRRPGAVSTRCLQDQRAANEGDHALLTAAREAGVPGSSRRLRPHAVRAGGRPDQERGRCARPHAAEGLPADRGRADLPRAGGHRLRWDRAALRCLLRRLQRRPRQAGAQAAVADHRRRRRLSSWIHLDDAATAAVLALEHEGPAIYNIVDDEPAPVREWLPVLAESLGAKPPRRFPTWLARPLAGEAAVVMFTEARGASNAKAKRELGWTPRYSTWRTGFPRRTRRSTSPTDRSPSPACLPLGEELIAPATA